MNPDRIRYIKAFAGVLRAFNGQHGEIFLNEPNKRDAIFELFGDIGAFNQQLFEKYTITQETNLLDENSELEAAIEWRNYREIALAKLKEIANS